VQSWSMWYFCIFVLCMRSWLSAQFPMLCFVHLSSLATHISGPNASALGRGGGVGNCCLLKWHSHEIWVIKTSLSNIY
jgi:hypothetical protein